MSKKHKREIKRRSILAARRYLEISGWDIIATSLDEKLRPFHIVGTDDSGNLAFVRVKAFNRPPRECDSTDMDNQLRLKMEDRFCHFLYDHPEFKDMPVRADAVDVYVISHDRALLKHTVNCINCSI